MKLPLQRVERVMAMHSGEEYVLVAMKFEEQAMVSHSLMNAYRSFWILCRAKMYPKRTGYSCLHCPFYADSAAQGNISRCN